MQALLGEDFRLLTFACGGDALEMLKKHQQWLDSIVIVDYKRYDSYGTKHGRLLYENITNDGDDIIFEEDKPVRPANAPSRMPAERSQTGISRIARATWS